MRIIHKQPCLDTSENRVFVWKNLSGTLLITTEYIKTFAQIQRVLKE
jgi:hypothetical protein